MTKLSHIIFSLLLLITGGIFAQSPSEIKGVINKYVKVNSFDGATAVNVVSSASFVQGDTVMLVQMKGALYSADDPNVIDFAANMGKYELTVVGSVVGNKITFNSPLKNIYDASESIQLIRIPSYTNAVVTEKLTCDAWDGEKGGILVLFASSSLTMNADIDVTGKGFRGGVSMYSATAKCFGKEKVPFTRFNILNFSADSTAGVKGEGAITNQFIYTLGRGPRGNGGGGGTGSYAGGGGGGNSGIGGNGAKEKCAADDELNWGGNGGRIDAQYFGNSLVNRRIYMGGGGGSGIQKTPASGSNGGNGGGIIILLVPELITNGYSINANGDDVTKVVTDGSSSGGGGGGGMVLLALDSVKNSLNVSAAGGNGGGVAVGSSCEGQGGGGGGGFIWFSGKSLNFDLLNVSGGKAGAGTCDVSSTPGNPGDSLNRLSLPLTGFLNNTIKAVPNTCFNTTVLIKGSRPQGGNGSYTYLWQYRDFGSINWLSAPGKNDSVDYKAASLTDTSQFRRIVSSDGMNDMSAAITINVFPQITNNLIDPDTTLCFGSPSIKIRGSAAEGGKGNFSYEWSQRSLTGSYKTANGLVNNQNYFIQTDTSRYYRRKATSDYCSTYDSVKVEILPVITENIVNPRQTICSGAIPVPFAGKVPSGGTGNYSFVWQKSNDSLNWDNTEVVTKDFETPSALTQTSYYRRIVSSGLRNCCRDTSKNIKIIVLPQISNNSISTPQTICEGSKPGLFNGSSPAGGDQNTGYRYKWEQSKNSVKWDSIEYSTLLKDYQAKEQDTTFVFRRVVYSGLNDCCTSVSNEIKVTVQPKIKGNTISGDSTICYNAIPASIKGFSGFTGGDGSLYSLQWRHKKNNGSWLDISGENQINYQPASLTDTTSYQRVITSGTCTDYSNTVKIKVLSTIQGNEIAGNPVVCENFPAEPLRSGNLSGGEPGVYRISWEKSLDQNTWEPINGESNVQLSPGIIPSNTYYRRIVKSGAYDCCQSQSNVFGISIDKNPELPEAGIDRDLHYQDTVTLFAQIPVIGSGVWSSESDAQILHPSNFSSKVNDLKFGRYAFYWTVTNGVCPPVKDSVVVTVSDLKKYTGFSPNGDGINDYLVIEGLDNAPNKDLIIMNRWGVEVFHSTDYQNDWDGRNRNGEPLPEDTYYYVLKVKDIYNEGKQRIYKGFTVIKR